MSSSAQVAFDLGAESGRAMVGRFDGQVLELSRGAPFSEPRRPPSGWPLLGRARPVRRALLVLAGDLRSGRAGPECRHRLLGLRLRVDRPARDARLESASPPRRPGHRGHGEAFARVPAGRDLRGHRDPVPALQHALPAARARGDGRPRPRGDAAADSRSPRLLADRRAARRGDEREHDAAPRRPHRRLGSGPDRSGSACRRADLPP